MSGDELDALVGHSLCRGTVYRLVSRHGLSVELAASMVRGMAQFLTLLAEKEMDLSPPTLIDTAWHEALIDTAGYRAFCAKFFGKTLDHHPPMSADDNRPQNLELTVLTVDLGRERFGDKLETLVWRRSKRVQVLSRTT